MISNLTPQQQEEIRKLIADGRKIEAIEVLREHTNLDLAAAKTAVENWRPGSGSEPPGKSTTNQKLDDLKGSLFAGRRIEAIKLLRDRTGMGLKESKEIVDAYEAELRAASPEKFTAKPASGMGCIAVALALFATAGAVLFFLLLKK